jgi:hypothetical protein
MGMSQSLLMPVASGPPRVGRLLHLRADRGITQNGAALFTASDKALLAAGTKLTRGSGVDFSFEMWIKPATITGSDYIFSDGGYTANSAGLCVTRDIQSLTLGFGNGTTADVVTITSVFTVANVWYHVVLSFDRDGNLTVYVNGVLVNTTSISARATQSLGGQFFPTLGALGTPTPLYYFGGALAGVRYYDGNALTAADVAVLYQNKEPISYANLPADIKAKLGTQGADWPLTDEPVVGTAYLDLHGSNDLTFSAAELVTNGAFAADTDWTKGTGWSIAAGVATSDGSQAADADLEQACTLTTGSSYVAVFTVSGYSAGNVCAVVGGTEGTDRAANNTFTQTITVASTNNKAMLRADLDFVGNVDNYSVKAAKLNATNGPSGAYASDSSGNGYHATLAGFSTTQIQTAWVPRGTGLALTFDGTDDYVLIPASAFLAATITSGTLHVNFLLNTNSTCDIASIKGLVRLSVSSTNLIGQVFHGGLSSATISSGVSTSTWHSATITWNGTSMLVYFNGAYVTSAASGSPATGYDSRTSAIGAAFDGSALWLNGIVDDVRVYNTVLTPTQIAQLYTLNEDQEVTGATATAHYTFNDGPPTQTATDGEPVAAWESIEGNRHLFRQTNILKRPKWVSNILGGRPVVRFEGLDDYLSTLTAILTGEVGTVVAFLQLKAEPNASQVVLAQADTGAALNYLFMDARLNDTNDNISYAQKSGAPAVDALRGNTPIVDDTAYCLVWDTGGAAGIIRLRVNGVLQAITAATGGNNGDWWADISGADVTSIGALVYDTTPTVANLAALDLAELIVYNRVLSDSELARCLAYGVGRYGVSP